MKIVLVLSSMIFAFFTNEEFNPYYSIMNPAVDQKEDFKLVGHRGAAGIAPENSMAAVKKAIDLNTPYIEIDIQRTKDNVLVVMHDETLDRTSNGKGKIKDKTWDEIKDLDVGSHFSAEFAAERLPSLEQVLELVKTSNSILIIEVKKPEVYPGIAADLNEMLRRTQSVDNSIVISFDIPFIQKILDNHAGIKVGCLYLTPPKGPSKTPANIEFISVHWMSHLFHMKRARRFQEKNIEVWAWTVNSTKVINKLVRKGFDGITTDFPNLVQQN